ncbi:MAG: tetratricopeptide repeat protein [Candidatus Nomurabacteria bacterium]|jgi:Tfp pilus assembly protein PilF|nr:tetratricopeptide repeat protein [Candidatus Nomurabacteria bacterium]
MSGLIFLLAVAALVAFALPWLVRRQQQKREELHDKLDKLWTISDGAMKEKNTNKAEKALLTILKFDERNAAAYNRLGILYAKNKQFNEALQCFEIAESLDYSVNTLHNIGLIYLEVGDFAKGAIALRQALQIEETVPRLLVLAKAEEKLENYKNMAAVLERAWELSKRPEILPKLLAVYERLDDTEARRRVQARVRAVAKK